MKLSVTVYLLLSTIVAAFCHSSSGSTLSIPKLSYVIDQDERLNIQNVDSANFVTVDNPYIHLGFQKKPVWVKIKIDSPNSSGTYKLRVAKPLFHRLVLFSNNNGWFYTQEKGIQVESKSGYSNASGYYFEVNIKKGTNTFYLKGESPFSHIYEISVVDQEGQHNNDAIKSLVNGVLLGLFIIMALFNLFLSVSLNDNVYRYYSFHAIFAMFTLLSLQGFWNQELFHFSSNTSSLIIGGALSVVGIAAVSFWIKFLNLRYTSKVMYRILIGFCILDVSGTIICYTLNFNGVEMTYAPRAAINGIFCLLGLIAGVNAYNNGFRPARFFLLGWTIYFTGVVSISLILFGILPNNAWTKNYNLFAVTTELFFMSFALADRYNILRREKDSLDKTLESKSNDLELVSLDNQMRQQYKENLANRLENIIRSSGNIEKKLYGVINDLNFQNQVNEKQIHYQQNIDEINTDFTNKLKELHPNLTKGEIEICGLLKLKYSNKDIASFRSTSEGAIKVAKSRIKKKLDTQEKLDEYIERL